MKHILVTGGCGFMGSHFIRHLYECYPDYRIYNLDLLTYAGNPDNLQDIEQKEIERVNAEKHYHFIYGDICDDRLLDILFQRYNFDLVVNFAAETHVDRSIVNMSDFIRTNIGGVRALIEAVRKHKTPRFIHISTDEIYGSVDEGYSDEFFPLRPSNPYSSSKAAADLIVQSFIRTHRVPALIVRGSNNFGPYQYPEKLIPLAITNIVEGNKIPVHGAGTHVRSWIHVKDFCSALDAVLHQAPDFEIYNIPGIEKTNMEILEIVAQHMGITLADHTVHISDRPGADTRYAVNGDKLRTGFGWDHALPVDESLGTVVDWYLQHKEWWLNIKGRREFQDHYQKQSSGQWY